MSIKHPRVLLIMLVFGICTLSSASAVPMFTPVVAVVDTSAIGFAHGSQVTVDPILERQFSTDTGAFNHHVSRTSGGNNYSLQTIRFDRSQLLTGLVVNDVYSFHTPLSSVMAHVQYARLNLYDSSNQLLLSTVIKGTPEGVAYVDFGSVIAGIDSILLTSSGGLSVSSPMGLVSSVFVAVPEPELAILLLTGLLLLAAAVRRTPRKRRLQ